MPELRSEFHASQGDIVRPCHKKKKKKGKKGKEGEEKQEGCYPKIMLHGTFKE